MDSEPVDNFDTNSSREHTRFRNVAKPGVEKKGERSSTIRSARFSCAKGRGDVKKVDQDSSMTGVENEVTPSVMLSSWSHSHLVTPLKRSCTLHLHKVVGARSDVEYSSMRPRRRHFING
ncbi:uncharacterized protein [Lolium perenne]|uniref:uncharacterized protein n=1 Tax=Lolium perenne TaxID=4522 RepID=UPI003A998528